MQCGRGIVARWLVALAPLLLALPAPGADRPREFLEGLRRKNYHDTALEYLDRLQRQPDCPPDLKEILDYEAGQTLTAMARAAGTSEAGLLIAEIHLKSARQRFEKFLAEHPKHALAPGAAVQSAKVILEQGRTRRTQAEKASGEAKRKLLAEAQAHFRDAQKAFAAAEKLLEAAMAQAPSASEAKPKAPEKNEKPPQAKSDKPAATDKKAAPKSTATKAAGEPAQAPDREQVARDLFETQMAQAGVLYESALAHEPDSPARKEGLGAAAKKYGELYEKHSALAGGVAARLFEARIYKELNQPDRALEILKKVAALPEEPETFRQMRSVATAMAVEMQVEAGNLPGALLQARTWLKTARGADELTEEGLKIRYYAARTLIEMARKLPANDTRFADYVASARKHYESVARFPGPYQQDAKTRLGDDLFRSERAQVKEPANFTEALERGDLAWARMAAAMEKLQAAPGKQETKTQKQQRERAQQQYDEARDEAQKYYRMALRMARRDVTLDQRNQLRFRLAYLYWSTDDYIEASLLGEFLARRYGSHEDSRKGAEIAVKACRLSLVESLRRKEDVGFEIRRMTAVAELMSKLWPGQSDTDEAWMLVIDSAVDMRDAEGALKYLERIPADSPRRGQAEIRAGQALWAAYLKATRLPPEQRPPQAALDKIVKQAQTVLEQGINRLRKPVDAGGDIGYALVYSVLALADMYVGAGQPELSIKWLEDPKIGPMTLVEARHAITRQGDLRVDTYKVAMRAYVGLQQVEKAEKAMNALESLAASGREGASAEQLTRIYIALGYQLQELLERLRNESKIEQAQKAAKASELFLTRISERKEGNTFNSLNWVAETFFGLGAGFQSGTKLSPEAESYYRKAYETFLRILARAKEDPKFAPDAAAVNNVKLRMAACARALAQYDKALGLLVGILEEKETRVDVQIEAAQTFQEWGRVKPAYFLNAINGGYERNGRYLVWGWGGIAGRLASAQQSSEKLRAVFHQARYNLAQARYELAMSQTADAQKATLDRAALDITRVYRLYPDMGGPEWYAKYDTLLQRIQKARGVPAAGLAGETRPAAKSP